VNDDPREILSVSAMSWLQIVAVAVTIGLNALDGFDVLAISFASPGIAKEWGVDRAQLGIVLSMELLGMAIGSLVLGGVADKIGRRRTILGCLVVMAIGMILVTTSKGIVELSAWRVLTGLGIGGMLAIINATAAEFSNAKHRDLCVSLMAIGYPIGAVAGGIITAHLLKEHDWRSVFYLGAGATAAFIPIVFWFVPESIAWLMRKQPVGALESINRTLNRMGRASIAVLPTLAAGTRKASVRDAFAPGLAAITLLVAAAYFFHITTFYFILKWVPKIVVDMGFAPSSAAGVLVWANVGGALGGAVLGLLTRRIDVKQLTIAALLISTAMVNVFGRGQADLHQLSLVCACAGFFTNAGVVGLYAIFAQVFPTHVRAFGTGFAIGIGRGGAVLAPVIAGFLFQSGQGLSLVAFVMALGSLVAAAMLMVLKAKGASTVAIDMKLA
jgi:benzoate transport